MENLFGFNRPSKRVHMNGAFTDIDTQLEHMANGLRATGRHDDTMRVVDAAFLVKAAKLLLEGDAKAAQRILDLIRLPLTE